MGTKASPMGEWKQLRRIGKSFGGSGVPIENLSKLTHTWRKSVSKPRQGLKQYLYAAWKRQPLPWKTGTSCNSAWELRGVNANIALDTGQEPLHQPWSNIKYILLIWHMLKGFDYKDPPRVNKLAVYPDLPDWLWKWGHGKGSSPQQQAVIDLVMIAFYYLLRVREYTASKRRGQQPRNQQFLVNDVTFFKLRKLVVSFNLYLLMQGNRSCFQRWRRHHVPLNRKTSPRESVCTMEHWKDKYLHFQWRHWQDKSHIFGCTHPMEQQYCVHIGTVLEGAMSRIGIWYFIWYLQQQS